GAPCPGGAGRSGHDRRMHAPACGSHGRAAGGRARDRGAGHLLVPPVMERVRLRLRGVAVDELADRAGRVDRLRRAVPSRLGCHHGRGDGHLAADHHCVPAGPAVLHPGHVGGGAEGMTSAVVTGAAHGIGAACVRTLVQRGFDVIACDVEPLPDSVLDALDALAAPDAPDGPAVRGRVWSMTVDVAAADAPQRIADEVAARCGELDLLVNNAGIGAEGHFADLPRAQWQRVMDVSLTAPFLLTQALWPYLRKPGGAVVNVSSIHGQRPLPEQAAY